jgi:aspartate-semialdehyde dehydrogenase
METETTKLLGSFDGSSVNRHDVDVQASCNRVPTLDGHLENVWADTTDDVTAEAAAEAMAELSGADLRSSPERMIRVFEEPDRPQPRLDRMLDNGMGVSAGGLRETTTGLQYNCLAHNTMRGAAGASVLNGELLLSEGYL